MYMRDLKLAQIAKLAKYKSKACFKIAPLLRH